MATNWVTLITQVKDFAARSDLTTAYVDYFIDLAENWFNNNLRVPEMETTNGSLTYSSGAITNPSDLLSWKRLSVTSNGSTYLLKPVSYEQNEDQDDGTTGIPTRYVIRGGSTLLRPTPDSTSYTVSGTYYQRVPALSDTQSTNWIITNYQDAYVYGALAAMEGFIQNDPRIPLWKQLFAEAVAGIRNVGMNKTEQIRTMTIEYPGNWE